MVEELSSSKSRVLAAQGYSVGESAKTRRLMESEVGELLLRELMAYRPKKHDGSYVRRAITSLVRVDSWLATVVRCLLQKEKRGGH